MDPGLVRAVKRQFGPVVPEERGALLEGWVLGQLRAHNEQQRLYDDIAYWAATESTIEVDFVLRRDHRHAAIEVKAAERYNSAFRTEDGIDVWPLETFHQALRDGELWS